MTSNPHDSNAPELVRDETFSDALRFVVAFVPALLGNVMVVSFSMWRPDMTLSTQNNLVLLASLVVGAPLTFACVYVARWRRRRMARRAAEALAALDRDGDASQLGRWC